jgi:hypothetical protein
MSTAKPRINMKKLKLGTNYWFMHNNMPMCLGLCGVRTTVKYANNSVPFPEKTITEVEGILLVNAREKFPDITMEIPEDKLFLTKEDLLDSFL